MSRFNYVEVHPPAGLLSSRWQEDAVEDAFLRAARSITELYSEALDASHLDGPWSMLRLACGHDAQGESVTVNVGVSRRDMGFEFGGLAVPTAFKSLSGTERGLVALDAVHAAVTRFGQVRGWDAGVLESCHKHVLNAGLVYRWASKWKSSPNRKLQARGRYRHEADGYGRVLLEVREAGTENLVAASEEAIAFSTSQGMKRSAATLRWKGTSEVSLTPYCGLGPAHHHGLLSLEGLDGDWRSHLIDPVVPFSLGDATFGDLGAISQIEQPLEIVTCDV